MNIVAAILLLAPALISLKILWGRREITKKHFKLIAADYVIYTFLIMVAAYGVMFFTYVNRSVSFTMQMAAESHISSASFVVKYSIAAIIAALLLPSIVKFFSRVFRKLEKNKKK